MEIIDQPNPYLVLSSILFIIPATLAAYKNLWSEYFACIIITLISSIHHATRLTITSYLDKIACYYLTYIFYISSKKINKLYIWIIGAGYSIIVYNVGYIFNMMAWNKVYYISTLWHISMHLVVLFLCLHILINKYIN
jgi:hypothetical protein